MHGTLRYWQWPMLAIHTNYNHKFLVKIFRIFPRNNIHNFRNNEIAEDLLKLFRDKRKYQIFC